MARVILLVGVLACVALGTFAAPAPAKAPAAAPSTAACSEDFFTNLNNAAPGVSLVASMLKALDITPSGAVTVFAPSDGAVQGAFQKVGLSTDPSAWTPEEKVIGTNLLKYHIAPGVQQKTVDLGQYGSSFKSMANNLPLCKANANVQDKDNSDNFDAITMLKQGKTFTVKAGFNAATITKADVTSPCLQQAVVHVIDNVLLPCAVTDIAAAAKTIVAPKPTAAPAPKPKTTTTTTPLTTPKTTVVATTNTTDIIDDTDAATTNVTATGACKTVSEVVLAITKDTSAQEIAAIVGAPTFKGTVFVPSEAAFTMARQLLTQVTANVTDPAVLKSLEVIKAELNSYHVVPNVIVDGTETTETPLTTLLAATKKQVFCTPVASAGTIILLPAEAATSPVVVKATGNTANVIESVEACNGYVHKIDSVLLPCDITKSALAGVAAGAPIEGATPPGLDSTTTTGTGTTGTRGIGATPVGTPVTSNGATFVPGNTTASSSNQTAIQETVKAVKGAGSAAVPSAVLAAVAAVAALLL